jgi:hypothetical protein
VKDRALAIILAVFLSFVTWSYTYARDRARFWIGLGLSVLGGLLAAWVPIAGLLPFGVWIWAIIDAQSKPASYYVSYPYPFEW